MTIFFYHPINEISQKIVKACGVDSFTYVNRGQMELILKHHMKEAGIDIDPQFHCQLGSLAGTVEDHMQLDFENNEVHKLAHKIIASNKTPWSYVKLNNGRQMRSVVGYCNSDPSVPFLHTNAQMAQLGLTDSTFIPTVV